MPDKAAPVAANPFTKVRRLTGRRLFSGLSPGAMCVLPFFGSQSQPGRPDALARQLYGLWGWRNLPA
jgi:hypothetical protein